MQKKPIHTGSYAPLNAYIAPLRPELWRVILGIVIIVAVYFIGVIAFFAVLDLGFGFDSDDLVNAASPATMVIFLSSFVFMAFAAMLASLWPARRHVLGLFGPISATIRDFRLVVVAVAPIVAAAFLFNWLFDSTLMPNQPLSEIWMWMPIAFVFLLVQVTAEEMVFRGFVMGQLAARFTTALAWMIIPSVLFGLVHFDAETYGAGGAWIVCGVIAYFAVLVSDLTSRTGNLGAAIAMHFGNNVLAILLISQPDVLAGLSPYTADFDPTDFFTLVLQILLVTLLWLAARLALKV